MSEHEAIGIIAGNGIYPAIFAQGARSEGVNSLVAAAFEGETDPSIEEIADEYQGKVKVGKVDVDQNQNTAMKYGIRSIPTILIMNKGEVVNQIVGAVPKNNITDNKQFEKFENVQRVLASERNPMIRYKKNMLNNRFDVFEARNSIPDLRIQL